MSTILMVTPFAPLRDGIATYAAQELRQLRASGHIVDVASPLPSAAHHHIPLGNPAGFLKLAQLAAGYDRTIIQVIPEMMFGRSGSAPARAGVWAAVGLLGQTTSVDLRIHELEYEVLEASAVERIAARRCLHGADRVTVHNETEADLLAAALGLARGKIEVIEHSANFESRTSLTREQAKRAVGLAPNSFAFVALGFLQHHKGFDLAAQAMSGANVGSAQLHIVGSKRVSHPDINRYVDQLRRLCNATPQVQLHERFVSDTEFDQWIRAADAIVLPYREVWSSGVLERAHLLETRVIASDLPQMRQQARESSLLFADLDDLRVSLEKAYAASNYPDGDRPLADNQAGSRWQIGPLASQQPAGRGNADPGVAVDLRSVQTQVERRARATMVGEVLAVANEHPSPRPSEALMALASYEQPQPISHRLGISRIKRTVLGLLNWQIAPMVQHMEDLQRATTEAVLRLEHDEQRWANESIAATEDTNEKDKHHQQPDAELSVISQPRRDGPPTTRPSRRR